MDQPKKLILRSALFNIYKQARNLSISVDVTEACFRVENNILLRLDGYDAKEKSISAVHEVLTRALEFYEEQDTQQELTPDMVTYIMEQLEKKGSVDMKRAEQ